MSNILHIKQIHDAHSEWNSVIEFTRAEITSFETRLQEIAKANTGKDLLAQAEHFQNQFILQKEVMDKLQHEIHEDENRIAENVKENAVAVEHRKLPENTSLSEKMLMFQKTYAELKTHYMQFMARIL